MEVLQSPRLNGGLTCDGSCLGRTTPSRYQSLKGNKLSVKHLSLGGRGLQGTGTLDSLPNLLMTLALFLGL